MRLGLPIFPLVIFRTFRRRSRAKGSNICLICFGFVVEQPVVFCGILRTYCTAVRLVGRQFVKRFALCYRTVVCMSCPVITFVHCGHRWMDQDETWHACRSRTWPHCVRQGPSSPSTKGAQPLTFRPMSVVAKRSPISATAEHLLNLYVDTLSCVLFIGSLL